MTQWHLSARFYQKDPEDMREIMRVAGLPDSTPYTTRLLDSGLKRIDLLATHIDDPNNPAEFIETPIDESEVGNLAAALSKTDSVVILIKRADLGDWPPDLDHGFSDDDMRDSLDQTLLLAESKFGGDL